MGSLSGIKAAEAAKVAMIVGLGPAMLHAMLLEAGATHTVESLKEIPALLSVDNAVNPHVNPSN